MGLDIRNKFDYSEDGIVGTIPFGTTTNLDLKITNDKTYIQGGQLLFKNATWGDYIIAQVIDIDNVLGNGAGTVLNEYITKRYIHPDLKTTNLEVPYAGKIPKDTYLRLKYTSTGSTDVDVAANYRLHKING